MAVIAASGAAMLAACSADEEVAEVGCAVELDPQSSEPTATPSPGNPSGCPPQPTEACPGSAAECAYALSCQSQPVTVSYGCDVGPQLLEQPCSMPFDYCPAAKLLCDPIGADGTSLWRRIGGTDEPPGCPWERPAAGSECFTGHYGQQRCGYWCDRQTKATWTVATCAAEASTQGKWRYDDACCG
ncbi:MAG: hypothetical protein HS104_35785 [Polyangiaceae bacterium]|nr:hypothetical protein [Polyangiaceae bacterium]MCE7892401.1 hypothetical protein [Sorangiineae bacterium PRO1]MCL4750386.1 hypothetical protein [Myxococcales bacterium]